MGRMLLSELLKIRRSRSLKKACVWYAALLLYCVMVTGGEALLGYGGMRAPFVVPSYVAPWAYWIFAAFSALLLGGEYDGQLFKNAFVCGVSREKYFAVKVLATYLVSFFLYIAAVVLATLIRTIRFGFDPDGVMFENYWLKVFVFNGMALAVIFAYVSVFNLLVLAFRSSGIPFILGVLITLRDFFSTSLAVKYYGYLKELPKNLFTVVAMMRKERQFADILNPEFLSMYIPCLCVGGIALAAGYVLFKMRDVD